MGDQGLWFLELAEDVARDAQVGGFAFASEVIDPPGRSLFKSGDEPKGAIIDVNPVPNLAARSVDGQRLIPQSVEDERGDEFFPMLSGTVVVGATGDDDILSVGRSGRPDEEVGAGLAG